MAEAIPSIPRLVVPPCFIHDPSVLSHWRYELRREAQRVYPGVYVGPLSILREKNFVEAYNIRTLIAFTEPHNCAVLYKNHYMADGSGYRCLTIDPGKINSLTGMVAQFPQVCQAIDETIAQGGNTLLFCETGNEKAAAAAVAYIIYSSGLGTVEATQTVQRARFCVSLNNNILYTLQTWEELCRAQAQVGNHEMRMIDAGKRVYDDDEDEVERYEYNSGWHQPIQSFDNSVKRRRSDEDM